MALINVLKSTDFVNAAYRPVKNRHFSANIVLCAENVSENERSGKAEYSYFVPALWHLLLSPPPTPIAHLVLSTADLAFFVPHPVRIFRRTKIDAPRRGWGLSLCLPCRGPVLAPRRGRRPRRPASAHRRVPAYSRLSLRRGRRPRRPVARSFHASGGDISRSGATSFCPRRQKDAKTPPKTNGFWISPVRLRLRYKKVPHRIACRPLIAAAPTHRAAVPYCVGAGVPDGPLMFPPCPQQGGVFRAPGAGHFWPQPQK